MDRRKFLTYGLALTTALGVSTIGGARLVMAEDTKHGDWEKKLTPEQYRVMREEGTERAFTSPLNHEKRSGMFVCAACGQELFHSSEKYDSGTGWPSFSDAIPGAIETKIDYKLSVPRVEYHCSRCGSHLGHVFNDGPTDTGLRYCNNGVALRFIPDAEESPK